MLTQERLRELLHYDPETGVFTWRIRRGRAAAGRIAGSVRKRSGYVMVRVDRAPCFAHRLVWLYVYGRQPASHIDHINGVACDNRLANLREATCAENQQNLKKARSDNKCGLLGVSWSAQHRKWKSQIHINRRQIFLGHFATPEEAHAAYLAAKAIHHPFSTLETR